MALMAGVNESLQEQRKLGSFLASGLQQMDWCRQPTLSLSNVTDDNSFQNTEQNVTHAFCAVSNAEQYNINKNNVSLLPNNAG